LNKDDTKNNEFRKTLGQLFRFQIKGAKNVDMKKLMSTDWIPNVLTYHYLGKFDEKQQPMPKLQSKEVLQYLGIKTMTSKDIKHIYCVLQNTGLTLDENNITFKAFIDQTDDNSSISFSKQQCFYEIQNLNPVVYHATIYDILKFMEFYEEWIKESHAINLFSRKNDSQKLQQLNSDEHIMTRIDSIQKILKVIQEIHVTPIENDPTIFQESEDEKTDILTNTNSQHFQYNNNTNENKNPNNKEDYKDNDNNNDDNVDNINNNSDNNKILNSNGTNNNDSNISNINKQQEIQPICSCGSALVKIELEFCYDEVESIKCGVCQILLQNKSDMVWHCIKEKDASCHENGFDLCYNCGIKQIQ